MELGYFTMPSHPPECGLKEGHDWDLQTLRWLDELGYQEAWIGEHHTAPWEPHPSPDLIVALSELVGFDPEPGVHCLAPAFGSGGSDSAVDRAVRQIVQVYGLSLQRYRCLELVVVDGN